GLVDLFDSPFFGAFWENASNVYSDFSQFHPDQHGLTYNPRDPNEILVGNDGGVYRGHYDPNAFPNYDFTWDRDLSKNLGISQFYGAAFHPTNPNIMLGGTQDNSTPTSIGDLRNWINVCGGDGGP